MGPRFLLLAELLRLCRESVAFSSLFRESDLPRFPDPEGLPEGSEDMTDVICRVAARRLLCGYRLTREEFEREVAVLQNALLTAASSHLATLGSKRMTDTEAQTSAMQARQDVIRTAVAHRDAVRARTEADTAAVDRSV